MRPLQPARGCSPHAHWHLRLRGECFWGCRPPGRATSGPTQGLATAQRHLNRIAPVPLSRPRVRKTRTIGIVMLDVAGTVRAACSISPHGSGLARPGGPYRQPSQFWDRVTWRLTRDPHLQSPRSSACHRQAGARSCQRPRFQSPSARRIQGAPAFGKGYFRLLQVGLSPRDTSSRWVAGQPRSSSEPRSASPNLPMHPISYNSFRALPASPYASHAAIAIEPAPCGSHCTCPSSQINGFTVVGTDSYRARCRGCATILVVLATFGVVCHAQMTPQDASGITSCEAELAKCQAVLGAVGAKEAKDVAPLAAVAAETGTPSSASEGARWRSSPPPIRPACTDCVRIDAVALRVCARPARAVQGHVRSAARTRAMRCSRPAPRSTPRRTQRAAQPCFGTAERTAVRAWAQPAWVSTGRSRLYYFSLHIYKLERD